MPNKHKVVDLHLYANATKHVEVLESEKERYTLVQCSTACTRVGWIYHYEGRRLNSRGKEEWTVKLRFYLYRMVCMLKTKHKPVQEIGRTFLLHCAAVIPLSHNWKHFRCSRWAVSFPIYSRFSRPLVFICRWSPWICLLLENICSKNSKRSQRNFYRVLMKWWGHRITISSLVHNT